MKLGVVGLVLIAWLIVVGRPIAAPSVPVEPDEISVEGVDETVYEGVVVSTEDEPTLVPTAEIDDSRAGYGVEGVVRKEGLMERVFASIKKLWARVFRVWWK